MTAKNLGRFEVEIEIGHYEESEGTSPNGGKWTSRTWRKTGVRIDDVIVEVDPEAIVAWLGQRAAKSKSGRAKSLGGAVEVYVARRGEVKRG